MRTNRYYYQIKCVIKNLIYSKGRFQFTIFTPLLDRKRQGNGKKLMSFSISEKLDKVSFELLIHEPASANVKLKSYIRRSFINSISYCFLWYCGLHGEL